MLADQWSTGRVHGSLDLRVPAVSGGNGGTRWPDPLSPRLGLPAFIAGRPCPRPAQVPSAARWN